MKKKEFIKPEITVEELSSALFHMNQNLEKANKQLKKAKKDQQDVFTNISHDLRSPITAIRNIVEYMMSLENWDRDEITGLIKLMSKRINYLDQMINDIFLLNTVSSKLYVLSLERINIGILLEEFFYENEMNGKYEQRKLELDVPEAFPYMVEIDCKMILRVLDNLFSNALKYSMQNSTIRLFAMHFKEKFIKIGVSDNGIGIESTEIEKIFDHTYMVQSARTPKEFTGCGLGLTIAKSIVEMHGGTIWCESEYGRGSVFSFTIPIIK